MKTKKKKPENEYYEIEVLDWDIRYSFGLNSSKIWGDGVYFEHSDLIIYLHRFV